MHTHLINLTLIPDERAIESFRPTSPILSRQALEQTPNFGEPGTATLHYSLRSTLDAYTLGPVKVPDLPTPPLPTLEDILYFYSSLTSTVLLTAG